MKIDTFSLINKYLDLKKSDFKLERNDLQTCKKDNSRMHDICEFGEGLSMKIIAFYINNLKDKVPVTSYCYKREYRESLKTYTNKFCYSKECIPTIENCIRKLDFLKAIVFGVHAGKNKVKNILKYRKIDDNEINKIIEDNVKTRIRKRRHMWTEIEDGFSRLLKNKEKKTSSKILSEKDLDSQAMMIIEGGMLTMHGHQIRNWIKKDQYWKWKERPKVVSLAHYHIMFPMLRYNSTIIFNGHFLLQPKYSFSEYYLSHEGCASFRLFTDGKYEIDFLRFD